MKVGDKVRLTIAFGYWKIGHEGEIKKLGFEGCKLGKFHKYDYAVLLDGDAYWVGFDENELEKID